MITGPEQLCRYCEARPILKGEVYCCEGCKTLDQMASTNAPAFAQQAQDIALVEKFGQQTGERIQFECVVEPLACEACMDALCSLPEKFPGLQDLQWNRTQSTLRFQFLKGSETPELVFKFLQNLDLKPHWNKPGTSKESSRKQRSNVMRLALTGALAGNLMLFSIPIYAGLSGSLQTAFEWIQGLIFLPVLFWSARPLLRTAWASLRLRQLSVDLPLVVAFLLGSFFSYRSLLIGQSGLYFDSLAGFLFLILWSRFLLEKSLAKHLESPSLERFFDRPLFAIDRNQQSILCSWDEIQTGDILLATAEARVPVDGQLLSSVAEFESAWINGESKPFLRLQGSEIQAGLRLISSTARIQVTRPARETQLAQLLGHLQTEGKRLQPTSEARWGQALVLSCFGSIFFLFLFGAGLGLEEVLRRSVALLIVACPCAVSFAAPLARAKASKLIFRHGFWIRNSLALTVLTNVRKVAFDKTGTLTGGRLVLSPHSPLLDVHWKKIILSLENISRHPVAESLRKAWGALPLVAVEQAEEIPGVGVKGQIRGITYEVKSLPSREDDMRVGLFQNGRQMIELEFEDQARVGLEKTLHNLNRNYQVYIISGDRDQRVRSFAKQFQIPEHQVWGDLKPEQKLKKIEEIVPDLYIGDGTNDLLALRKAPASIAIHGASLEAQAAADILMLDPDLGRLPKLFEMSQATNKLVRRNLSIALIYNTAAGIAAVLGFINPLIAALLMPIASLILLGSTLWGNKELRMFGRIP